MIATLASNTSIISDAIAATIQRAAQIEGDGRGGLGVNPNPSGATGVTTGWTAGAGLGITAPASTLFGPKYAYDLRLANNGTLSNNYAYIQMVNVQPELDHTFTFGVYKEAGASTAQLTVTLYASDNSTVLKTQSYTIATLNEVQWLTFSWTSAQNVGNFQPYIRLTLDSVTSETFHVVNVQPAPVLDGGILCAPTETNLALNGSGGTGDATHWVGTSYVSNVGKFAGGRSQSVIHGGGFNSTSTDVAATPGTAYNAMVWVLNGTFVCFLDFHDTAGNIIGVTLMTAITTNTYGWNLYYATGIAPLSATGVYIGGLNNHGSQLMYLSGLQIAARAAGTAITLSGNEITDEVRALSTSGDGLSSFDGSTGIWPATTNLCSNGGAETNTTGITEHGSTTTRITSQQKFGTACFNVVTANAAANEGPYETFTATVAVYEISAWVRGAAGGTVRVAVRDNSGANLQAGATATLTTTWQKITLTTTNLTAATWRAYVETNVQQALTFQFDGLQPELGSVSTPYVETNGGTATRAVSRAQMATASLSPTLGAVSQAWRLNFASTDTTVRTLFSLYKDANNYVRVYWDGATHFVCETMDASVSLKATSAVQSFAVGALRALTGKWSTSGPSISVSGGAFTNTAGRGTPFTTPASFDVGSHNAAQVVGADLWWTVAWSTTIDPTDSSLTAATVPTFVQLLANNTNTSLPTALWNGVSGVYTTADAAPATPYVNTAAATAARYGGLLTAPGSLLRALQGAALVRHRPAWNSSGSGPNASGFARLFNLNDGTSTNRLAMTMLPLNAGLQTSRVDATGSVTLTVPATWTSGVSRTDAAGWNATVIALNPNLGGWTTGANTKLPVNTGTLAIGSDNSAALRESLSDVLWVALFQGDYTKVNMASAYWNLDADPPSVAQINIDSPGADCVAVLNMANLAIMGVGVLASGVWGMSADAGARGVLVPA